MALRSSRSSSLATLARARQPTAARCFWTRSGRCPLELPRKLLRVLQEKRCERLGEDRTRYADVRIIAATNRDLKKEVAAGRSREDLYYRLNVFPMHVPVLRQRKEDIPLLAQHFVQESLKELRCPNPRLSCAGVLRLQSYDWPGNVRELQNVIERAAILARGSVLGFGLPVHEAPPAPRSQPNRPDEARRKSSRKAKCDSASGRTSWHLWRGPTGGSKVPAVRRNSWV